ncbi:GTP-binding nuclear protein Ran [Astathelohania contejeani]|uniref:GTP-binding nuclear protein Ran n=1 Tax=Astathelohania contejeani TaxID=164912 RepID=A0ABQ7HXW4_9MICR|nr:GTP-binding nuclear protein Ran [Thelohania contejeani]
MESGGDNQQVYKFKIVLVGDGGTGKTTYINRIREGSFIKAYHATVGAVVHNLYFRISPTHTIHFEVWDTAGQEVNSRLSDAYYIGAHGAIILFDVTSRVTLKNVPVWLRKIRALSDEENKIPVIVCGNKADCRDRKVKKKQIDEVLTNDITYYTDMSARSNYNFEVPFLELAKALLRVPDIKFISNISLAPAEVLMDETTVKESMKAMGIIREAAEGAELPDDDFE